jgi:Tol biopolymer transport system component
MRNGPILFAALGGKLGLGVYRVDPDGSHLRRLVRLPSTGEGAAGYPSASPDGRQVAFVEASTKPLPRSLRKKFPNVLLPGTLVLRLEVVPVAGGTAKAVPGVDFARAPAWSPDGETIRLLVQGKLFSITPAGTDPRILGRLDGQPEETSWSPDGKEVAVAEGGTLSIADANGANARAIVGPGDTGINELRFLHSPSWSPDGDWLAYVESRVATGQVSIKVVDSSGHGGHTLVKLAAGNDGAHPTWSPDGRLVAFVAYRGGKSGIFTVPSDGGAPRLVFEAGGVAAPSWAPAPS